MSKRPAVRRGVKQRLIDDAGGKCANPGCPNTLTEIHHIREWHVYFKHDPEHMICLCPACHDTVSRGHLKVSQETAYTWKHIARAKASPARGHLYVEPSPAAPRLMLGTIAVQAEGKPGLVVFSDWPHRRLAFKVNDMNIMLLGLEGAVSTVDGISLARVLDGHFAAEQNSAVEIVQRPGHFRITHPLTADVLPDWALGQMRKYEHEFAANGSVLLLEMKVTSPNVVRIQGVWLDETRGYIITESALYLVQAGSERPLGVLAKAPWESGDTVIHFTGPLETALFGWVKPS